eukprot:1699389-Pyramimonas_sp.AAC.1
MPSAVTVECPTQTYTILATCAAAADPAMTTPCQTCGTTPACPHTQMSLRVYSHDGPIRRRKH